MTKKAHIVYFSGTGCTALAAETLCAALLDAGVRTRTSEIVWNHPPEPEADETLVLMFSVYAADAPGTVARWLSALPRRTHGTAVVVSVSGGGEVSPNTACRMRSIRRLTRKGYAVISEYMLCMPSNFIIPTPDDIAVKLLRILPEKCARIAAEIAAGTKNRKQPRFLDRVLLLLFSAEKVGAKLFGKTLKAKKPVQRMRAVRQAMPERQYPYGKRKTQIRVEMRAVHALFVRLPAARHTGGYARAQTPDAAGWI